MKKYKSYLEILPYDIIQIIWKLVYSDCLLKINNLNFSENKKIYQINNYLYNRQKQFYYYFYDFWCYKCNIKYSDCCCDVNNKILFKKTVINKIGPNYLLDIMLLKKKY